MKKRKSRSLRDPMFLRKSGLKGGALGLFEAIKEKGVEVPSIAKGLNFREGAGKGKHIVVLGAGVAGLTAAYEFLKHNTEYMVTIIEATNRIGGRSLTVRPGDSFTEVLDGKSITQTCEFDEELGQPYPPYLNCGPGRIPSGHRNVLNYCKELNVDLQVYIMESRSNRLYNQKQLKNEEELRVNWQNRRIANDTNGYVASYLYQHLDAVTDLDDDQKEEFRSLLTEFGKLQEDGSYEGSSRSGYTVLPGVHTPGEVISPIRFEALLNSAFWKLPFYQPEDFNWQQTSFQPVGGMDMIEKAFGREIIKMGGEIRLNSAVTSIVPKDSGGYVITYQRGKIEDEIHADVCISNIPIPLLDKKLDMSAFSKDYAKALQAVIGTPNFLEPTCKVGWQADRRLWQDPEDPNEVPIFGGISWTCDAMVQMWYPSDNFHGDLGVLTGAYNYSKNAADWGKLTPKERVELARKGAATIHGEEFASQLKKGLSIAWQNIPTQKGGWVSWKDVPNGTDAYNILIEGDRDFYITGDQVSHLPGWKEGAMASALNVWAQVVEVEEYRAPLVDRLPDTAALVYRNFG